MRSHFEEQKKMLDSFMDVIARYFDQHAASLEQDARQPRLAMEAHGHANTKTRERTEGAATAVQAMRGDGFSACRVEPGPNTSSTSFGVKAEPPALPCRDGARVVSPILGDAHNNSRRWLSSHRQNLHSNGDHFQRATSSVLRDRGTKSRGGLEEGKIYGLQFHPLGTTAASGNYLLLPTAGGSLRQNRCKIGRLIQAVRKVVSAPARFWDRGVRWIVVKLYGLGQVVTSCSVLAEEIRWLPETKPALMPCKKKSSRLERLEMISRRNGGHVVEGDSR